MSINIFGVIQNFEKNIVNKGNMIEIDIFYQNLTLQSSRSSKMFERHD